MTYPFVPTEFDPSNPDGFTGYRFDLEDPDFFRASTDEAYLAFRAEASAATSSHGFGVPDEIHTEGWMKTDNQRSMGSCQGNDAANNCERGYFELTGQVVNLSRAFCYLASQEFDGISGDRGSTLRGGTKALARGIPTEEVFPYSDSYSDVSRRYRAQKRDILADTSKLYYMQQAIVLRSEQDCWDWLSMQKGSISLGIRWSLRNQWEHDYSYRPSGGGHAIRLTGYLRREGWPRGIGYLLHNSWGTGWGKQGWGLIHPNFVSQMIGSGGNIFVGRGQGKGPPVAPDTNI